MGVAECFPPVLIKGMFTIVMQGYASEFPKTRIAIEDRFNENIVLI